MGTPALAPADNLGFRTRLLDSRNLPLLIEPDTSTGVADLCERLRSETAWLQARLLQHGALLFRGFAVTDAHDFERIARAIDDELKNEIGRASCRERVYVLV